MIERTRPRPNRAASVRRTFERPLEALETRCLMAGPVAFGQYYVPRVFAPRTISHYSPHLGVAKPIGSSPRQLARLDNDGKLVSGKDREGDEYTLVVHGPGVVIVTDATPNDGVLDDDIDTIRIYGSDPRKTYVTGQVTSSARVITDGTVKFNHLIAESGAKSIILNGFNLTNTVPAPYVDQPLNVGPEIYLPGGVSFLQFNNVEALIDPSQNDQPFEIVIGNPNTPLRQSPKIKIGSVFNTVIDSTLTPIPNGIAQTDPTVNFIVNGRAGKIELVSATKRRVDNAGQEFNEPVVSTTGRTAFRAMSAGTFKVYGAARNVTLSRAGTPFQPQTGEPGVPAPTAVPTQPFQGGFSGLSRLRKASFGGPTDAVGIDVQGPIGKLKYRRGMGDPTGALPGATNLGYNEAQRGYASFGYLGGLVRAKNGIKKIGIAPANLELQTPQDPDFMQLDRKGSTKYFSRPGHAMTSAAIVAGQSIGDVHIVGTSQNSQIAAGFDYEAYVQGLEPTRGPSRIRRFKQRGSLIDSVVSASQTPGPDNIYETVEDAENDNVIGPGRIKGKLQQGQRYFVGGTTALGYFGAGVYARRKSGDLPPPTRPTRNHKVAVRP